MDGKTNGSIGRFCDWGTLDMGLYRRWGHHSGGSASNCPTDGASSIHRHLRPQVGGTNLFCRASRSPKVQHGFQHEKIKLFEFIDEYLELYAKAFKRTYKDTIGKCDHSKEFFSATFYSMRSRRRNLNSTASTDRHRAFQSNDEQSYRCCATFIPKRSNGINADNPVRKIKFYSEKKTQGPSICRIMKKLNY